MDADMDGNRYYVSFIDDYSRRAVIYLLKQKSEVYLKFKEFYEKVLTETGVRIQIVRSDNGGEYVNQQMEKFFKENGIKHELSVPYNPDENGIAERFNRTEIEGARAMLYGQNMEISFWGHAATTRCYLYNRSPHRSLDFRTPHEKWTGRKPSLQHLRVFGVPVYAHEPKVKRRKLDMKSKLGVFVGYAEGSKGYKVYDPETKRIGTYRDVVFVEDSQPVDSDHCITCGQPTVNMEITPATQPCCNKNSNEEQKETEKNKDRPRMSTRRKEVALTAKVISEDPKTYKEALESSDKHHWEGAMKKELQSIEENNTWEEIATIPDGANLVSSKWVYKTKLGARGEIIKFKARIVARGFSQIYGLDYEETFAPVAKLSSLRSILAWAAQEGKIIHQMDIVTAFLNPELKKEIFMETPQGYAKKHQKGVLRLKKGLYGLKQSGRLWYYELHATLLKMGFVRSDADHSIYSKDNKGEKIVIIVYVDDLVIITDKNSSMDSIKGQLSSRFKMEDGGELSYILGMRVKRNIAERTITLDQEALISRLVEKFGLIDAKAENIPMHQSTPAALGKAPIEENSDAPYQSGTGSLNWIALSTRPDISFAVSILTSYNKAHGQQHWNAVKNVIKYLKGTAHIGLTIGGKAKEKQSKNSVEIIGYTDASYAECLITRRSTGAYIFKLGVGAITWQSKKQPTPAISSTEAEYMAMTQASKEAIWLTTLFHSIGVKFDEPIMIYGDNQGALKLARNQEFHQRTKHIDTQWHFVRKALEDKKIRMDFVGTKDMIADGLTKALMGSKQVEMRENIGILSYKGLDDHSKGGY